MKIATLKTRIKALAAEQPLLKRARKTSITPEERSAIREKLGLKTSLDPYWAAIAVKEHAIEITACHNLYNELRGEPFRHDVMKGYGYSYEQSMKKLTTAMA